MAVRTGLTAPRLALALVFGIGVSLAAEAQRPPPGPPPYTPAADAKDLKSVLFNWTWHMGMLRGVEEHELMATLEYQGTGTLQVNGQPCNLTKYRISNNYQLPGERIQYACTQSNGRTVSGIEVVHGPYAWNEDIPGAELVAGKGKATPMPNAVAERLIRLWASPQGAPKAALQSANQPDPIKLEASKTTIGATSVKWEGSKPVVTFAIPGVRGATATAVLDKDWRAESVVVKQGGITTEFTYSDYQDWNNPLNKVEVFYAGKMLEKKNGKVVRDLTTKETETGSVYVVMPVPASVKAAIKAPASFPAVATLPFETNVFGPPAPEPAQASNANAPTPRTADGHPDLTGTWNTAGLPSMNWRYGNRRCGPWQTSDCSEAWNQTVDYEFESPSRYGPSRPLYKPELWDKIQQLDMWTNKDDPVMTCQPLGIPREGAPRRIVQMPKDVIFFYGEYADGGGGYAEFRDIPIDGRKHDPARMEQTTYMGYTVGNWEGDTLVLDSRAFVDSTWLGRGGLIHSDQMRVV
ncbi:MAG TPA: hypothetical protein VFJ95_01170, partial [Gammaproteobacteria bacterium]|nr:hypothetical protein [Gammaproteobacteria bacterium]